MKVEYEVKAPLFIKLLSTIGYVAVCAAWIFFQESSIVDFWKSNDWVALIAALLFFFVSPVFMLIVFFTRTVFTDTGIIHTNFILRKIQKTYEEIDTVEITGRSDIRLHFVDGTSIKVLTGQNYLSKTLQVLEKYVKLSPRKKQKA